MISNFLEILILSIVQGISEFLPVSSSAHLFLVSEIYKFESQSLLVDVGLHLGSLLAIIFYFRNELKDIVNNKNLLFLMVIGSLPLIILGAIIYKTGLINYFRNIEVIAWTTLIFALLLYIADKFENKKKIETDLQLKSILIIGLFQILALIPGVSRSGIVITAGRFLNFSRYDSTKISFYLSIPAIAGASFLSLKSLVNENIDLNLIVLVSILFSFIFSYLTIKYFLIFVKKFTLNTFVIYRIILSAILFLIIYT
ncbi:MAG: undecaprenyl-diphosphate phosphatase [Candidatus Pelagibacter sp.]